MYPESCLDVDPTDIIITGYYHQAFMKKVRKAVSRGDKTLAEKREATAPQYTLDHLVRERYPRFDDALGDLDDALSLVHLFATLPADGPVQAARTERCRQLALEWQYFVARAHALTKVFVSVKGVYFQAEVGRQPVTWIVPHAFTQVAPPDVDFRIMLTFLEFYETLLKFTLFKLYHRLDMAYPPVRFHALLTRSCLLRERKDCIYRLLACFDATRSPHQHPVSSEPSSPSPTRPSTGAWRSVASTWPPCVGCL